MEVSSHHAELLVASNVSLRAKFLVGQKAMRLAYANIFNNLRGIVGPIQRGPGETRADFLERRSHQLDEIDEVTLDRYKLERRLAHPEELRAIDERFVQAATGKVH